MKKVAVMFADGTEEIESITVVDVLRRAGVEALCVGLENLEIKGAHGVKIAMDLTLANVNPSQFDAIVLPGGLPGSQYFADSTSLGQMLRKFDAENKLIAAICAAPMALERAGVLKENFTCYDGFEGNVRADHRGYCAKEITVKDQNVLTGRGPAYAMLFALELVGELCGKEKQSEIKAQLLL